MFPETSTDSRGSGAWLARLVLGALLLLGVLALVLYAGARFIVWPNIDSVVGRYAGTVEERLGTSLTWKAIHSEWTGLRPSIEIIEPVLGEGDLATRADRLSATISLRSLLRGQAELDHLVLDNPLVVLRRSGDSISLAALEPKVEGSRQSSGVLQWLLQQPDVRIGGGRLVVTDTGSRRSLRFDDVALVLRSQGRDHAVRLDIGNANALAATVVLQADLRLKPQSDPADWRNWAGNLQLDARQLATQVLLAELPAAAAAAVQDRLPAVATQSLAGQVDPSLSLQVDDGKVANARLRLRSDDLMVALADRDSPAASMAAAGPPRGSGLLRFDQVNLDVRLRPTADGTTEISASTLELSEAGGMRLRGTSPQPVVILAADGRMERLQAGFERLDIGPVVELAKLLSDPAAGQPGATAHRVDGDGELREVTVAWQRGAGDAPPSWRVRAAFERASMAMAPTEFQLKNPRALRVPELQDIAGSFEATEAGGKAMLRTPAASPAGAAGALPAPPSALPKSAAQAGAQQSSTVIRFGGVLVEPEVAFNLLDSQFSWKVDHSAGREWLSVQMDRLVFATADGSASMTGRYRTGGRGAGSLDLRARIGSLQASKVWRYLPHEVPENVRQWIGDALEAGTLEGGEARWRGDIRDFPYRLKTAEEHGEFRLTAKVRDLLLKYSPQWPALHGIAGDIVFDRVGMEFRAERATLLDVPLTGITARMDDIASGLLEVGGKAQGDLDRMLKFVNTSPLAEDIGSVTRSMIARGPASLEVELGLPLKDLKGAAAKGRLDVAGATLDYQPAQVQLAGLQGRFDFTSKSLAFNGVRGTFAGTPIEVSGKTGEPGTMRMQARGTMSAKGLRPFIGDQLARHLHGSAAYAVDVDIGRDGTRLSIESDLAGLASDWPAPLTKTADAHLPFRLAMAPAGGALDRVEASLGAEVLLVAERGRSDARRPAPQLRAAVAVNRQPALPDQGVSLQFTGQRIDLDAWRRAMAPPDDTGKAAPAAAQTAAGLEGALGGDGAVLPLTVSLVADEVRVGDRNLNKVVLGASRTGNLWLANISAREVNGFLTWSETGRSPGKLTARLGRFEIPKSQQQELATALSTGPSSLPAVDITAQQFILGGYDFGTLELVARNATGPQSRAAAGQGAVRPRVWQLERLRLSMPAAELQASGQWERNTSLAYRLDIKDAGGFLNRLQLKDVVKGGNGSLTGELRWSGSPLSMDLPSLAGTMDIAIRDGQFLKVEPGAAKLIGVLNLQALPKLLTLNFRNIFEQGFAFDELRGSVAILDGIASTDSLAMRGLQAVVQIKGQADLDASTQDLRVVVIPELNGGLATLAYAAIVNPAVGLGVFLAQSLFSQPLSRALAHEIDITGSWSDPKVVERKRERFGAPLGQ
jgi:uncharacterized protein YhdP